MWRGIFPGSLLQQAGVAEGDFIDSINGYPLDAYGETSVSGVRTSCRSMRCLTGWRLVSQVALQFCHDGEKKSASLPLIPSPIDRFAIVILVWKKLIYELVGGLALMDLSLNNLDAFVQGRATGLSSLNVL